MQIFKGIEAARAFISEEKKLNKRIGLVPTMGALHNGHLSLISKSIHDTDTTIASIFVNPLQFNNLNDLTNYPRTLNQDIQLLEGIGCHSVFIPTAEEMYKKTVALSFDFKNLDKVFEGTFRPGHFNGVAVVVSKLFNILQPNIAYFGQKDFQQFLIIKQIVDTLNFPVQLQCGEIIREPDGLAMSSRNQRLSKKERELAPLLYKTLVAAQESLSHKDMPQIKTEAKQAFSIEGARLEYFELANRESLHILNAYDKSVPSILLIAAYVGDVRLIDNLFI